MPQVRAPADEQQRGARLGGAADEIGGEHHALPGKPVGPHAADERQGEVRDHERGQHEPEVGGRAEADDRPRQRD